MAGAKIGRIHFAVRIEPKTLEPRGAITPGVPELRLKLDKLKSAEGHRGMGIRKSSLKTERQGVGGWGSRSVA